MPPPCHAAADGSGGVSEEWSEENATSGLWEGFHYSNTPDSSNPMRPTRIFVLADTHNRLPGNVLQMAGEADEIWHLGDVCAENILDELRAVGPKVTIVRGNCDDN